ncbi:MAG: glycosyltransferase family 39 protein [Bdellovibrionota bacterium]
MKTEAQSKFSTLVPLLVVCVLAILSVSKIQYTEFLFYNATYYVLLTLGALWMSTLLLEFPNWSNFKKFLHDSRSPLLIALLSTVLIATAIKANVRVQADESLIASNSLSFFQLKEATVTNGISYENGIATIYGKAMPLRPQLLAFLASILHSLKGYSLENLFIVNLIAFFFFVYFLMQLLHKKPLLAKISALLLVCAHPVLLMSFRSAGLESLFLTLLIANIYFMNLYLEKRKIEHFLFYLLTFVTCLHTRYEAILPLFCIALFFLWTVKKEIRSIYSKHKIFIPLSLLCSLPFFWQRIIAHGELSNFFNSYPGGIKQSIDGAFNLSYLLPNLISFSHACCAIDKNLQFFSPWIIPAFFIGFAIFCFKFKKTPKLNSLMIVSCLAVASHLVLLIFYVAGEAAYAVYSRLFLDVFVLFSLLVFVVAEKLISTRNLFVASLLIFLFSIHETQRNNYTYIGLFNRVERFVSQSYKKRNFNENDILISTMTAPFIALGMSTLPAQMLLNNQKELQEVLRISSNVNLLYIDTAPVAEVMSAGSPLPENTPFIAKLIETQSVGFKKQARLWKLSIKEPANLQD